MSIVNISSEFVDLVLDCDWSKSEFADEELEVLIKTVRAAGFNPKRLINERLKGYYLDQDGSKTGETFLINQFCPFRVKDEEDNDYYFATGWLDCMVRYILSLKRNGKKELVEVVKKEIERSVPLRPIQITLEKDFLCETPPEPFILSGCRFLVDHTEDSHKLSSGIHKYCSGSMNRHRATYAYDAIVCQKCYLRVLFPKKVETYGELREALPQH